MGGFAHNTKEENKVKVQEKKENGEKEVKEEKEGEKEENANQVHVKQKKAQNAEKEINLSHTPRIPPGPSHTMTPTRPLVADI